MPEESVIALEIRAAAASAMDRFGLFDEQKISVKHAKLLGDLPFEHFKSVVETACKRDSALWARICALVPPADAPDLGSRMQRMAMEPVLNSQLRAVHERLQARGAIKLVKDQVA